MITKLMLDGFKASLNLPPTTRPISVTKLSPAQKEEAHRQKRAREAGLLRMLKALNRSQRHLLEFTLDPQVRQRLLESWLGEAWRIAWHEWCAITQDPHVWVYASYGRDDRTWVAVRGTLSAYLPLHDNIIQLDSAEAAQKALRDELRRMARMACSGLTLAVREPAERAWIRDWIKANAKPVFQTEPEALYSSLLP